MAIIIAIANLLTRSIVFIYFLLLFSNLSIKKAFNRVLVILWPSLFYLLSYKSLLKSIFAIILELSLTNISSKQS
jgi:hypothetical protein